MPIYDLDSNIEEKVYNKDPEYLTLREQVKRFLSIHSSHWFCVEEMPLKEWKTERNPEGISVNNICSRLSEYAGEEKPWVKGRYREGKSYKEWCYIEIYADGNLKLI